MITSLIPSFNAGELSPAIHLRSDLDKYRSGCRTLRNMLITPYGGAYRRAGFAYVNTATSPCRLFQFQVSTALGFILEFGDLYLRFYFNDVIQVDDVDYVVVTPYAEEELAELQMIQINNVAYLTHPNHPVHKLWRVRNAVWGFEEVGFSYPPMLEENLAKTRKLTTSAAGEAGDSITLTSSFSLFEEGHLDGYFEISHERKLNQFDVKQRAVLAQDGQFSDPLIVQGAWNFITSGTWDGKFLVQRSDDGGAAWHTIREFISDADQNHSAGGEEVARVLLRLGYEHNNTGSGEPHAVLSAVGAFIRGLVQITDVISATEVDALVINPVEEGATSYWRESAWSDVRGHPRTVAAHEGRIIYGGNAYRPQTVWASAVDDYENFQPGGVEDDDSWTHSMASDQQNSIQWLVSQKALLIGTSGDEWVMSSSKEESIITPTNVRARRHSGNGSEFKKARLIDSSVLFVQRGGKKLRDMTFSFEADGYVTSDLTLLADHISGEGIIETAYQAQPYSTLWCVTAGGELIALTYDRGQNIIGWSRHTTGGAADGFESVAVRTMAGEEDQVWVVARRTIDGTVRRYIERVNGTGFFLEDPWSTLDADTLEVTAWGLLYTSWEVGQIVGHPAAGSPWAPYANLYFCHTAYTSSGSIGAGSDDPFYDGASGGDQLNWSLISTWSTGPYTAIPGGGIVYPTSGVRYKAYHNGKIYHCKLDHYSTDAGSEPGVGGSWGAYWDEAATIGTPLMWAMSSEYAEDAQVTVGGIVYTCTTAHTPTTDAEPGTGVYWEDYWIAAQGSYAIGARVSRGGRNYVCLEAHTPSAATKPGTGADWADFWAVESGDNLLFYVDSGVTRFDETLSECDGLDHLEGETVQILANGAVLTPRVVAGGAIQFDQPGDPTEFVSLSVGLAYESFLEPMALEVGLQDGTSVSREKRIHELVIYFSASNGCKVASTLTGTYDTLPFRTGAMVPADAVPLFTGPFVHKLDARHDLDASFVLKQDLPLPMKVLAVVPKWNVYGG